MQPIKIRGIVTRSAQAGENGKMLTVLSDEKGRVSIWGRGLGSQKHPAKSAASPFSLSEFVVNPRGDIYSLSSASLIRNFYGLSSSVEKLSLANYFCALSESVLYDAAYAPEVLKLLLNSLHYLEGDKKEFFDLWLMFEMRALCVAGFMPNLHSCVICGGEASLIINPAAGGVVCSGCRAGGRAVSSSAFAAMKRYIQMPLKDALSFGEENKKALNEAIDISGRFVREHIGLLKSRDYLQKIVRM